MKRIDLNTGVIPLSEFRANATQCVAQVRETRRPMVITQHGKSASVLMDVGEYEKLMDSLELLQDVQTAESQIDQGLTISHTHAKRRLLANHLSRQNCDCRAIDCQTLTTVTV